MAERWNVCSPVPYMSRGQEKTKWLKHGVMFRNRAGTGFNILLESIPTKVEEDGKIKLMAFEPNDEDNRPSGPPPGTGRHDLDDEVTF